MTRSEGHVIDQESLRRLSPVALRAARKIGDAWQVDSATMARLLDIPAAEHRTVDSTLEALFVLTPEQFCRASLIIAIYRAVGELFAGGMAERWPSLPNRATPYDGWSPIEFMAAGGTDAMFDVLGHVRAMGEGV
jgi:hypothetical protein